MAYPVPCPAKMESALSAVPAPILEARNVNLLFSNAGENLHVLRDVSFSLQAGEVASVVGPSGSGKTSLLMVLAGLERASSGNILVDGTDIVGLGEDRLAVFRRNNFGILFQNFHLIPSMTALENVAFTLEIADPSRSFAEIRRAAQDALAEVGLGDRAKHLPSALSGGEQQRVGLARAIVGRAAHPACRRTDGQPRPDHRRRRHRAYVRAGARHEARQSC